MSKIKQLWLRVPLGWRIELVSAFHTIVAAMLLELLVQLKATGSVIPTDTTVLWALGGAVVRATWKAFSVVVVQFIGWLSQRWGKPDMTA